MITILSDKIMMHITDRLLSTIKDKMFLNTALTALACARASINVPISSVVSNMRRSGYHCAVQTFLLLNDIQ